MVWCGGLMRLCGLLCGSAAPDSPRRGGHAGYVAPPLALHPLDSMEASTGASEQHQLLPKPHTMVHHNRLYARDNTEREASGGGPACTSMTQRAEASRFGGTLQQQAASTSSTTPAPSFRHQQQAAGAAAVHSGVPPHVKTRHRRSGSGTSRTRLQQPLQPQTQQQQTQQQPQQQPHQQQPQQQPQQAQAQALGAKRVPPPFFGLEQGAKAKIDVGSGSVKLDEEDDSQFCPTCLEPYTDDNPKMWTACGHHYHVPCLYEWLERKDTCPICECKISDGFEA